MPRPQTAALGPRPSPPDNIPARPASAGVERPPDDTTAPYVAKHLASTLRRLYVSVAEANPPKPIQWATAWLRADKARFRHVRGGAMPKDYLAGQPALCAAIDQACELTALASPDDPISMLIDMLQRRMAMERRAFDALVHGSVMVCVPGELKGLVCDAEGYSGLKGVAIHLSASTMEGSKPAKPLASTDAQGRFSLAVATVPFGTPLTMSKAGYAPVMLQAQPVLAVRLAKLQVEQVVFGADGASLTDKGTGATLTIPPNTYLVYADDGSECKGEARCSLRVLEVADSAQLTAMPGEYGESRPSSGPPPQLHALPAVCPPRRLDLTCRLDLTRGLDLT